MLKKVLAIVLLGVTLTSTSVFASPNSINNTDVNLKESKYDLPVLNINTENGGPITSKDYYVDGNLKITGTEEFTEGLYDGEIRIKGRGNSTWGMPKKPYKIKLPSKASILGLEPEKDWVLLANYSDKTLMRNKLALDFAEEIGMEFTSDSMWVEVVLNGEYAGNYLLCEHVEVKEARVNIDELEGDETDPEIITGGYLLEVDYRLDEKTWFHTDKIGTPVTFKSPDEPNSEQFNYLTNYMNEVEDRLLDEDFTVDGKHYSDYIDVDSFIDYYLVNEIFKNYDAAFRTSVKMYKPRNGKLHMGPIWDFDISAGNANFSDFLTDYDNSSPEGWWMRYNHESWYLYLFKDPEFVKQVEARFWELIDVIEGLEDEIDKNAEYLQVSQSNNFDRWHILNQWVWPNVVVTGSYQGEVNYLKGWLNERIEWMKKNMGTPPVVKPVNKFDLNNDEVVDLKDLAIISKSYGKYNANMDFNEDLLVNQEDILIIMKEMFK